MRNALLLFLGLAIGVAGTWLIRGSIPPVEGTPESRILSLENELRESRLRLAKIDPAQARPNTDFRHALSNGARAALEDLKAGRPVDMNNIFDALKPIMRDLSPIFDKMRRRDERRHFEAVAGELSRKYNLTPEQQASLKEWLKQRADANAALFQSVAFADGTRFEDLIKASRNLRPDDGIDSFMEGQLKSPDLETFRRDRLTQRAERVQQEADGKVQRLNNIVNLDNTQQDQVFSIMARSSRDFDPQMQLEGVSADSPPTSADSRNADIRNVLRPDQQATYDNWRAEQRTHSEQEAAEIGLKIPEGWDPIDADL